MDPRVKSIRRATAATLSVAMLALSVAIPVLERAELVHQPVVESEHNPATCLRGHDHTVCTQVGASFSAPSAPPQHQPAPTLVRAGVTGHASAAAPSWYADGHHSRAPPRT